MGCVRDGSKHHDREHHLDGEVVFDARLDAARHALAQPLARAPRQQQIDGEHQHEEDELQKPRGVGHHCAQLVRYGAQR